MAIATINGADNWYEMQGEGPPLLIIGGFAIGRHQGEAVTPHLARSFRVVLWDHRGQGLSDRSLPDHYSPSAWSDDLKGLLDHLGIQRTHLWGTSTGSMIAVQFAARYPDRVGGLITHPSFTGDKIRRQMLLTYAAIVEFFGIRAMVRVLTGSLGLPLDVLHSEKGRETEDWITANCEGTVSTENYVKMCQIFANTDLVSELPKIRVPTLVLAGTSGPVGSTSLSSLVDSIQKTLPGCQVKAIEGGGTAFLVQKPEESAQVVADFLSEIPLT